MNSSCNDIKAVILAGGYGTRISEETWNRPKPMIEIGGQPILWHIMKLYAHHGVREFVICLGYMGYVIKEYFSNMMLHSSDVTVDLTSGQIEFHASKTEPWRVTLIDTGADTMTGGRIKRVKDFLNADQPFFMTYGDGLADINISALLTTHQAHGKMATVTSVAPPGRYGSLLMNGNKVTEFMEKPDGDGSRINGGFFVLEPGVLEYIAGDATHLEQEPLMHLARDGQLMAHEHNGFWLAMDTLRDKRQLEQLWEGGAPWKLWKD